MATPQQSSALLSAFVKQQMERYGKCEKINKHTAKWAARDIIDSYGYPECVAAIEWACKISDTPFSWNWFTSNVGRLLQAKDQAEYDKAVRAERRRLAKEWLSS